MKNIAKQIITADIALLKMILQLLFFDENYNYSGRKSFIDLTNSIDPKYQKKKEVIWGELLVLKELGVIKIDKNNSIFIPSRNANFTIGSLFYYISSLEEDNNISRQELCDSFLVEFSRALQIFSQKITKSKLPALNSRRIVNILIKSEQIRNWKNRDVYLHIYDKKWEEYHLIGASRQNNESDLELIKNAMKEQLGLSPDDYIIDNTIQNEVKHELISKTNGILTEYTIALRVIKNLNSNLRLKNSDNGDVRVFRWFTWDEIQDLKGPEGEKIMITTKEVLKNINLSILPVCVKKADDARYKPKFFIELGNRFTLKPILLILFAFIISLLIGNLPLIIKSLSNYRDEFVILSYFIDAISAFFGIREIIKGIMR